MTRKKRKKTGGRKSKGPRKPLTVRFPLDVFGELENEYQQEGFDDMNAYVLALVDRGRQNLGELPESA
ncbi:hypothetical protein ADL05_24420 [Nocardiopsis sp. NRRL B-16309]|nr:hypothetical protein ADL05_24420 [Nocardiopsis sp. NRRL B-16309]